ncbi:olfactory receptor 473-like [Amphibalanus amphitrite]|uniref:olfactory receptor 473-like n=1 Tax=Amphibalanus amphitrite TaxID=1232801 RepID=UPI001C917824|nr:olfactory receptor 473-like [Amphibalanus amphitrite]
MTSKVVPVGTILIGYLGAASSSVPILAIVTSRRLRGQPMFRTITNLALCEAWFLLWGGVLGTVNMAGAQMEPHLCAAFLCHNLSVGTGGSVAMLVVSVERYVAVVHGLRYSALLTPRRLWLLLLAPWAVAGAMWLLTGAALLATLGPAPLRCRFLEVMPSRLKLAFSGTIFALCAAIVAVNLVISRVALRHQADIRQQRRQVGRESREDVSAYWGVLRVTVVYILFQTPANVVLLLELLWKQQPPALIAVASVLVLIAFAMDGWFFGYYNAKLRRRYALLFGCGAEELDDDQQGGALGRDDDGDTEGVVHLHVRRQTRVSPAERAARGTHPSSKLTLPVTG